jgi:hypothetical protein
MPCGKRLEECQQVAVDLAVTYMECPMTTGILEMCGNAPRDTLGWDLDVQGRTADSADVVPEGIVHRSKAIPGDGSMLHAWDDREIGVATTAAVREEFWERWVNQADDFIFTFGDSHD